MQSMEVDVEGDAVEVVDLCADWNTVRVRIWCSILAHG
jgi:hypothetical protein